ncbi:MAG: hypothetical protein JSW56_00275 [Deltaproteobacteria bacterium]|nr:MAG: hypothetical protein JSW56_00275 [Deltaproteobacteria bacterium]
MMRTAGIILTLAVLVSLFGCLSGGSEGVPTELIGVWKTSVPKYKGCSIELTRDYIIFTNSHLAAHINANFVLRMKQVPERGHYLCTILYENIHEQRYKFSFYYYPTKGGVIRLKNLLDVDWRKVKPIAGQQSASISG